ncbi:hypothetical protein EGW08_022768 [Elysia chlorotica]|uniref:Retinoblastoma-associated protein A-box domain-containing protein n=1 Tax=Elysia chlorotica TaxID=188477 RepID=A0A433SK36_ELYCH|nr:hypothetical protein EGW08_022768 [Elysia chlorotica]
MGKIFCKHYAKGLLENDSFHRSLFACCLEIVIFSYNSQRTFPWIVDIFEFSSYQFYKVIEIIIRAEKGFSRDVVKHLNHVTPPSHMEAAELLSPGGGAAIVGATDRFSSPTPGNAKRRLFGVGPAAAVAVANSTTNPTFTTASISPSPGTSNAQVPVSNVLTGLVPPTPPPGVSIISTPSQLPVGTSLATTTSSALGSPSQGTNRSILLNQLKGGSSYSVVVPNKV